MSSESISRTECASATSLADLLATLKAGDLPERKRQELASAIRTAARALGRSPEIIPADGRLLANRMKEVAPAAIGISRGRWNNVRALLRTALALVQPISPGRHRNDLSPEWLALSNELGSRSDKIALSRALHFCSARGIAPNAVTEGTFDEYRLHLDRSLLKRPNETFALTVRAWRRAEEAIEGWPKIAVSIPDRRRYWVSGWGRFPEPLRRDCQAWCDRLAGHDLLEDAPFRPVRPATLAHREWQIRSFASALVRMDRDPSTLTSLRDLIEIDAFKTGLRFFLDREGGAPTTAIADLASSLKAIARHHVRVEPHHLDQMGSIIRRLAPGRRGLTEANRTRLRPFDDRGNILALLKLPDELMRLARRHRNLQRGAVRAQLAVAIEILLMAPVRMSNLVKLDIEQNLVRPGQSRALHIVIGAEDVKNREPLEYPLPLESIDLLERYIGEFRPHLSSAGNSALFPGIAGGPKNQAFFGTQISRTVYAHTGLRVHPHLFRHIAAKLFLDAHPGSYELVRRVLGHRSIDTTTSFYTGLETTAAVRHFDKTILNLRRESSVNGSKRAPLKRSEKGK
jgi:site-specific recombinase XerD